MRLTTRPRRAPLPRLPALFAAALMLALGVGTATAQRRLRLPAGRSVSVTGSLRPGPGRDRVEYTFRARAGQRVAVRLTSNRVSLNEGDTSGAVFFVLDAQDRQPPDFGDYPYGGPVSWDGRLPRAGLYRIRVLIEDGPDDPPPAALLRLRQRVNYKLSVRFPRS